MNRRKNHRCNEYHPPTHPPTYPPVLRAAVEHREEVNAKDPGHFRRPPNQIEAVEEEEVEVGTLQGVVEGLFE